AVRWWIIKNPEQPSAMPSQNRKAKRYEIKNSRRSIAQPATHATSPAIPTTKAIRRASRIELFISIPPSIYFAPQAANRLDLRPGLIAERGCKRRWPSGLAVLLEPRRRTLRHNHSSCRCEAHRVPALGRAAPH